MQVLPRCIPLDCILKDQAVSELYVHDKLVRTASHSLLRAFWCQMGHLLSVPLETSKLPSTVRIMPLQDTDEILVDDAGQPEILNQRTGHRVRVFGVDYSFRAHLVVHHIIDICSNNCAVIHFAQSL